MYMHCSGLPPRPVFVGFFSFRRQKAIRSRNIPSAMDINRDGLLMRTRLFASSASPCSLHYQTGHVAVSLYVPQFKAREIPRAIPKLKVNN